MPPREKREQDAVEPGLSGGAVPGPAGLSVAELGDRNQSAQPLCILSRGAASSTAPGRGKKKIKLLIALHNYIHRVWGQELSLTKRSFSLMPRKHEPF